MGEDIIRGLPYRFRKLTQKDTSTFTEVEITAYSKKELLEIMEKTDTK